MDEAGRIKLVADMALFSANKVLLVKYKDTSKYDGQAGWFLPDDYLHRLEHPVTGALRILREQAGLTGVGLELRFIESFEGNRAWHLVFHFAGALTGGSPAPGANIAAMDWFSLDDLPEASDVAHGGWAHEVLQTMRKPANETTPARSAG